METNTVLLSTEEYNELRDFKKNITDGKRLIITYYYGDASRIIYSYYTDDQIADKLNHRIELQEEQIDRLNDKIKELKNPKPVEISIEDIKKMSYREFKKWKKS